MGKPARSPRHKRPLSERTPSPQPTPTNPLRESSSLPLSRQHPTKTIHPASQQQDLRRSLVDIEEYTLFASSRHRQPQRLTPRADEGSESSRQEVQYSYRNEADYIVRSAPESVADLLSFYLNNRDQEDSSPSSTSVSHAGSRSPSPKRVVEAVPHPLTPRSRPLETDSSNEDVPLLELGPPNRASAAPRTTFPSPETVWNLICGQQPLPSPAVTSRPSEEEPSPVDSDRSDRSGDDSDSWVDLENPDTDETDTNGQRRTIWPSLWRPRPRKRNRH